MTALEITVIVLILGCFFIGGILFGAHFAERFWNWYYDKVWDEQEEDQPKSDDFPGPK